MSSRILLSAENHTINSIIESFFSGDEAAKTAINLGYDINASFLPQEFDDLLKGVKKHILANIYKAQNEMPYNEAAIDAVAIPRIEAELQKVCKIIPESQIYYPHPTAGVWNWIVSLIWPVERS